jgi:glutamate-5-semialdehyde dehydrogenase
MDTRERVALGSKAAAEFLRVAGDVRDAALKNIEASLSERRTEIAAANQADLDAALESGLPEPILKRLVFDEKKLKDALAGLHSLAAMPDPVGRVLEARVLDEGLVLRRVSCPIGLVAMIFESRPDALVQMAGLAAKSGNAIVLKGGSEARNSNRTLAAIIAQAGEKAGLPENWLTALETREQTADLLALHEYVDLVIPRGSREFVARIKETSRIPVLGHSDGVCHVYVHEDADPGMTATIAVDSKTQYPAACNAAEVLLVHSAWAARHLSGILLALLDSGVRLVLCARSRETLAAMAVGDASALALLASPLVEAFGGEDWSVEYLDLRMAVRIVDSLEEAIAHINRFGSGHTDAIVTASEGAAATFMNAVDSASVYRNASTRFADGYRYGLGAEVGIATGKLHARGPMGVDGLLTYKWKLEGSGQIVADYASGKSKFIHREIPIESGRQHADR